MAMQVSMYPRAANGKFCGRCALAVGMLWALAGWGSPRSPAQMPEPQARDGLSPASSTELEPNDSATKSDYEAATRPDQIGRIVVPVMVNGRGPFMFVLDTGATSTVLTPQLVATLGLQSADDGSVTMNGATGSAIVSTAVVERIAAGDVVLERQHLPIADALVNGIDGILGVDALAAKRIMVDFTTGKIEIRDARHHRPLGGAERIPAELRYGGLLVVDAYVDRIRVKAVIDTGSETTLGNDALDTALRGHAEARMSKNLIDVLGETLALQRAERRAVATLKVGDVRADRFNVVFGEFYIFRLWNLERQPALVIGMDLISKLNTLVIDYERREVQLRAQTSQPARLTRQ
jgi:predicted aspartyl protease